ncbi:LysR substrate-binding domain-containing protein [Acerihabitans arboris]|uniref:LysR family transcriptional regulator n=1 Tax=Acerihabitans arboris TaxID=2691583 RepID=A0A845SQH8_9GAMM|nr:LysR substrate-binding domain-containing protein [Acerihabitans arboris]NDL65377.1 LysR family transcriptional regulator [Acerihabitans arboris]
MNPLPSLDVLKTFIVVAERLNFTHAARHMHLTQGAVSRQIAGLEQHLGCALFIRQARGLALTEPGLALLAPLQQAMGQIDSTLALAGRPAGTLRVKCPTCAMRWLLPRIIQLQNQHPEIDIALTTAISHGVNFASEHFDAAVVFGRPDNKRVQTTHLFDEVLTPVCIPELWRGQGDAVARLADKTLLHPTRDRRDWLLWLRTAGCDAPPPTKAQHFDTLDLAMTAALQGYGIAMGDLCLLEFDLQARRLIAPFPLCIQSGASYYLIHPEQKVLSPPLVLFKHWLEREARDSRQRLALNLGNAKVVNLARR